MRKDGHVENSWAIVTRFCLASRAKRFINRVYNFESGQLRMFNARRVSLSSLSRYRWISVSAGMRIFRGGGDDRVGNGALINNIYIYMFIKHYNENQLILCRIPQLGVVQTLINEANIFFDPVVNNSFFDHANTERIQFFNSRNATPICVVNANSSFSSFLSFFPFLVRI